MTDLSHLPRPKPDAPEGYYPDPLGGPYDRWWDGSILIALVTTIPTVIAGGLSGEESAAAFAVGLVAHLFVASFTALATALLYFDLRARRTGRTESATGA